MLCVALERQMRKIFLRAFVIETVLSLCQPLCSSSSIPLSLPHLFSSPLPSLRLSFCASGASTASPYRKRMKEKRKSIMDSCCAALLSLSPVWTSGLCCILMLWRDGGESAPLSPSKHFENK